MQNDVLATARYDGVLHFAAKSIVGESMVEPSRYWRNNVGGSRDLLDAVTAHGVPRFVFSSTAAVYGEPDEIPIRETAPTRPTNTYGATKLAVDLMIRDETVAHGLGAVSLRYFNVAGASRGAGERHATETHLIPIALDVAAGRRPALDVYGTDWPTPDGTCIRDYVHVEDLARAHVLALRGDRQAPTRCAISATVAGSRFAKSSTRARRDGSRRADSRRRHGGPATRRSWSRRTTVASADLGWTPTADLRPHRLRRVGFPPQLRTRETTTS